MIKQIDTRIINKHDTEANWNLATDFIPLQGEIIIYDTDENYDYERFKLGDGQTPAANLPFVSEKYAEEAVQDLSSQVAFISEDSSEDIVVDGKGEFTSPYAGTIHRFSVEVNCAPLYIPEDNLGPEFNDYRAERFK